MSKPSATPEINPEILIEDLITIFLIIENNELCFDILLKKYMDLTGETRKKAISRIVEKLKIK